VVLMGARLLDYRACRNRNIKDHAKNTWPYATEWVNLLGSILHERHRESGRILGHMEDDCEGLAEKLEEEAPEIADVLTNLQGYPNPVWRLAEALSLLQRVAKTQINLMSCVDSSLLVGRPNGLAAKRRIREIDAATSRKTREIRSLIFTDSVLDYLVHVHVLPSGNHKGVRPLAFKEFLSTIRKRYGFCVDEAPPGITVSNDLLQANRAILERRLRDLGLLTGVNDAEAMKRLRPRFDPRGENAHVAD
jgi:hypothetical protein